MIETLIQVTNLSGSTIYLDLYDDVSINLNLSFAEIQDITSKNSGYSQTFKVPGTKKNNTFFNYMFDVNATNLSFNMQKSVGCSINYKGNTVLDGTLRLLKVFVYDNEVEYEVNVQDEVGIFINAISNNLLSDLDYNDLNHVYNATNVELSWDASYSGGTTTGGLKNGSILYPFQHIGYLYDSNGNVITSGSNASPVLELNGTVGSISNITTPMRTSAFRPAIQIYDVLERIFTQNSFNVESNFFNSEYFQRLYMPLLFNSETYFINSSGGTSGGSQVVVSSTRGINGWGLDTFPCGTPGLSYYVVKGDVDFDTLNYNNGPTYPPGGWDLNDGKFYAWGGGQYTVSFSIRLRVPNPGSPQSSQGRVYASVNHATSGPNIFFDTLYDIEFTMGDIESGIITGNFTVTLASGDYLSLVVEALIDPNLCVELIENVSPLVVKEDTVFTVLEGPNVVIGSTINIQSQITPEYKQLDFLKGLVTQFNLVFVKHPFKTDTYIMEPFEFYVGEGQTLDWTDKLDMSKPIVISPLTNLIGKGINFIYDEDVDGINVFTKTLNNNRNFGTLNFIPSGVTINDKPIEFKSFFAATPGNFLPGSNQSLPLICPHFYGIKDITVSGTTKTQLLPMKIKPRILHYVGKQPLSNSWYYFNEVTSVTKQLAYYPFLHHQDEIPSTQISQALDLNFGNSSSPQDAVAPSFTNNTAYELYYADYIEDLLSPDARLVNASFDLTVEDIINLEFKDLIFVKDAYYRINKISNFNLINVSSTQVELVKLLNIDFDYIPPTPTPTVTPTPTPSPTPTLTPTPTPTVTPTPTPSPTPTLTPTPSPTPTITPTPTPSPTPTITPTPTPAPFLAYISDISGLDACGGGNIGQYNFQGSGSNLCNSTTVTQAIIGAEIVLGGDFWLSDGTNSRYYKRNNTPINTQIGTAQAPCEACPTPTPTPTPTATPIPFEMVVYTGNSLNTACSATTPTTVYYNGALVVGTILYAGPGYTNPIPPTLYLKQYTDTVYVIGEPSDEDGKVTAIVGCPTPTPTPTPVPTDFTGYISYVSADNACAGGSFVPFFAYSFQGTGGDLCSATSIYGTIILSEIDPGSEFWISDGTQVRSFTKGLGITGNATPNGACSSCPTPTPTPTPTLTPTPTPTLTPTPTPTATPIPAECVEYVNIEVTEAGNVTYLDCRGVSQIQNVGIGPDVIGTSLNCVQRSTLSGTAMFTITGFGPNCVLPTFTPTPTPTLTPTPSPTPTATPFETTFSGYVSLVNGPSACAGGEYSNVNITVVGTSLCSLTKVKGLSSPTYGNVYGDMIVNDTFWVSNGTDEREFLRDGSAQTGTAQTACTACAAPTPTPVPTSTPVPSTYDVYERCDLTAIYYVDYNAGNLSFVTINSECCSRIVQNVDSAYIASNYPSAIYFASFTNVTCPCE